MRTLRTSVVWSRAFSLAALAALVGCSSASDSPTGTQPIAATRLAIVVVGGGSQQGFVGQLLTAPVTVQVVDSAGNPLAGKRRIRFSVAAGAGSVSDTSVFSADNGTASVVWRLGPVAGSQQLTASLADVGSNADTRIFARGLSLDEADLVVIRGATPGMAGILIRQDNLVSTYTLTWPDTVLRLLPRGPVNAGAAGTASWQEVTAFSVDHAPTTALQPWTDGVDTVRLVARPTIAVPFTVWVTHDFDTTAARARYDLANVDAFWRPRMTGLRVGAVRIENAPDLNGTFTQCSESKRRFDPSAINIYYLATQVGAGWSATTCDPSTVLMGMNTVWSFSTIYQLLLAHQVGHALGLDDVNDDWNVMSGSAVFGGNITTGQIYRMHFHYWSALNSVLGLHPVGERNCSLPLSAHCPAQTFVAW